MTEEEKEELYDAEIAPQLLKIAKRCKDIGMPFLASVEYSERSVGTTADLPKDASIDMWMALWAIKSKGNADKFIGHLLKESKERGHNSVYLTLLEQKTPKNVLF